MLYNGSNTKLTLQACGGATGVSYGSKIIVNGGGTSGGNISFINDSTRRVMNSSGVILMVVLYAVEIYKRATQRVIRVIR